jgi:L-threonylcarbamoyladenylate synthase
MPVDVIKVAPSSIDHEKLREIGERVKEGEIVVYPKDTAYAIGGDPWNTDVIDRILEIKRRDWTIGMSVLISDPSNAQEFGEMPPIGKRIAYMYWPGQVTIVIPKHSNVPERLSGKNDSIALRMPFDYVALRLIKYSGGALIGTSANLYNQVPPCTAAGVLAQIGDCFDILIDSGPSLLAKPSTIISVWNDGSAEILREGAVPAANIFENI